MKVKNGLTISQTGGSRNAGGKMSDQWLDLRFLQGGISPSWEVEEQNRWWVLLLEGGVSKQAQIAIMPSTHPREIAIDAGLEFVDRLWERRVPKFIDSPDDLMSLCVKAAIRQG